MLLLLLMLAVLLILVAATLLLMAWALVSPPRMTDGKAVYVLQRLSPGDLRMQFETTSFNIRDQRTSRPLTIAAWWIPHPAGGDRTVVLVHGYADAKVGAIAWAPTWQQLGYHILAIDLRAHGESGGKHTTAGFLERHDVNQVLDQLRAARPGQTRHLVLFGISMGAAVALAAAEHRDDVAAMVLECPTASFPKAAPAYAQFFELPLPTLFPLVLRIAQFLVGADFNATAALTLIPRAKCRLLVIHAGDDPFVSPEDARKIESAVTSRVDGSVYWEVPDVPHLHALAADPDEYRNRIEQFLLG